MIGIPRSGWVKVYREIGDHPMFRNSTEPFDREHAFEWLFRSAAFESVEVRVGESTITVERGSLIVTQQMLAEAWHWDRSKIRRFLEELMAHGMISVRSANGAVKSKTLISISNYDKFQGEDPVASAPVVDVPDAVRPADVKPAPVVIEKPKKAPKAPKAVQEGLFSASVVSNGKKKAAPNPQDFEGWWAAFPKGRKGSKATALQAFRKALSTGVSPQELTEAAERYAANGYGPNGKNAQFVRSPESWLNQRTWESEDLCPPISSHAKMQKAKAFAAPPVVTEDDIDREMGRGKYSPFAAMA